MTLDVLQGLSVAISSSVWIVGGPAKVPEGNLSCMGLTLGEGLLRVDK